MSNVEIRIFPIAHTIVDQDNVRAWLDYLGATEYELPAPDAVTDPALLIALAAKRCYKSFQPGLNPNVSKVRSDIVDYLDNVMQQGHGSVLEHSVYSFAIEGVSRVFTAEMNRHRAGWAISEGSLRFIRFDDDIPWWIPSSLIPTDEDDADLTGRKLHTLELFNAEFDHQRDTYKKLMQIWAMNEGHHNFAYKKKVTSCLRRIIGMGVATGGVWTGNIRALRHVMAMRADASAEEEIFHVFTRIVQMMQQLEPALFGDFALTNAGGFTPKYRKV